MELQNTLNKPNRFKYGKDVTIINDNPPADQSFGVHKSAEQSGISVTLEESHFMIWKLENGLYSEFGEVNQKSAIVLGWTDGVDGYYFQSLTPTPKLEIRITGVAGNLVVDSDPNDGIGEGEADLLSFNGQINQGSVGTIGNLGTKGEKGDKGESGIVSSGQFKWSNWMGQAPGFQTGNMEYGGASVYGEATQLTFHKEDADGVDQSTFLDQYLNTKSGQIKTILDANPSHHNVYQIVGASIDSNGNYVFDVYNVSYDDIAVTTGSTMVYFVLVGEQGQKGEAGTDGVIGVDGAKGEKGEAGADGVDGAKGDKGEAGLDGAAANQGQKGEKGESSDMGGTMTSHIIPDANASYDLGNAEYKIRHLFLSDNSMYIGDTWIKAEGDQIKTPNLLVGDINLNNAGRQNEVDGTSGHWSIQEGSNDLFLINRNTGKKYKFNLTEM